MEYATTEEYRKRQAWIQLSMHTLREALWVLAKFRVIEFADTMNIGMENVQ